MLKPAHPLLHCLLMAWAATTGPVALATTGPVTQAPARCCQTTDDFPWQDLPPPGGHLEVTLDTAAPVFRFHTGESRFAAFRLPLSATPYRVEVRALASPAPEAPGGWRVFYPQAVLLDGDQLLTRQAAPENALLEMTGSELSPQGAYVLYLPIDSSADGERYLVLHTVPAADAPAAAAPFLQSRAAVTRAVREWQAGATDSGRLRIDVVPTERSAPRPGLSP